MTGTLLVTLYILYDLIYAVDEYLMKNVHSICRTVLSLASLAEDQKYGAITALATGM